MSFPTSVKEDALVACGRCCSICHKFCGIKMEVHHIREVSEGGDNTDDNAIPLCFDCHADMRSYDHQHPKGNKYSEQELKKHRDRWYGKIKGNIGVADRQAVVETDKQIYEILIRKLPWNGSIEFIRTKNFADNSYDDSRLNDIGNFEQLCKNPHFEFIDPDLEALRGSLLALIDTFTTIIAEKTHSTSRQGLYTVYPDRKFGNVGQIPEAATELNNVARQIVETYNSLVRTATRKLGILPPTMI